MGKKIFNYQVQWLEKSWNVHHVMQMYLYYHMKMKFYQYIKMIK